MARIDRVARVAEFEKNLEELLLSHQNSALFVDALKYASKWYEDAHDYAMQLSSFFGITIEQACGVIAATSIRTRWNANIADAGIICGGGYIRGLKIRRHKSYDILELTGDDASSKVAVLSILNGPKVCAFFQNILDPKNSTAATIDTWMMKAIKYAGNSIRGAAYDDAQTAVRNCAARHGMSVPQFQAWVWILIRGNAD